MEYERKGEWYDVEELTDLQHAYYLLKNNKYSEAVRIFEKVMADSPTEPTAYIGALLAQNCMHSEEQLVNLPLPLSSYALFESARKNAGKGYGQVLFSYEEAQRKLLEEKEEKYLFLLEGVSKTEKNEKELSDLIGCAVELRDYKDAAAIRSQLEKDRQAFHTAKAEKKKEFWIRFLPCAVLLLTVVAVVGTLFALPKRDGLRYALTLNGYAVVDCDRDQQTAVLREKIYGIPVTEVGRNAFKDCNELTQVTLNGKIDAIGKSAFSNCRNLKGVVGAETVEKVGGKAFKDCKSLRLLKLAPDCQLARTAFRDCDRSLAVFAGDERQTVDVDA